MNSGLRGKTVLVSGASGGIGSAVARAFVAEEARVILHFHRNQEAADELAKNLGADQTAVLGADLTDPSQVARLFEQASERFGPIDHVVANAGVWPPQFVPLEEMEIDQWNQTIAVNLTSVFLTLRQFFRQIKETSQTDPSAVLIGSTAGVFGEAGHCDYAVTKSGVVGGLLRSLKNEMPRIAPRGRINAVSPGWTMTPMTEKFSGDPQSMKRALSTMSMRKFARPDDIANAVVFLTSPQLAGHLTGQNLVVSGGMEGRQLYQLDEIDLDHAVP